MAYVLEVGDTRPAEVAESEFLRFTEGAAMLVAATPLSGHDLDADHPPTPMRGLCRRRRVVGTD